MNEQLNESGMHAMEIIGRYGLSEYARTWVWQPRPKGYRLRTRSACYANAARLAGEGRGTYCEGWVGGVQHAWAIDKEGRVIETTPGWYERHQQRNDPYVGVPIRTDYVHQCAIRNAGRWWTVLHHAAYSVRPRDDAHGLIAVDRIDMCVEEVIDLDALARFDIIHRAAAIAPTTARRPLGLEARP